MLEALFSVLRIFVQGILFYLESTDHSLSNALQFTEEAASVLGGLERDADSASGAWFGSGEKAAARLALRHYLSAFVENVFMPTLFVDFKCVLPFDSSHEVVVDFQGKS